jgi:hypothetical protein
MANSAGAKESAPRFIVDINVGKLARLLRMMGYDALLFEQGDDDRMIRIALAEHRVVLTRDTQLMKRRVVTTGRLRALLLTTDRPEQQLRQVIDALHLNGGARPFTVCIECNQPLEPRSKQEVAHLVPPYVFKTQEEFVQCPRCQRVYWKGTHWQAMTLKLRRLRDAQPHKDAGSDASAGRRKAR